MSEVEREKAENKRKQDEAMGRAWVFQRDEKFKQEVKSTR